jgi:hypothetical protein
MTTTKAQRKMNAGPRPKRTKAKKAAKKASKRKRANRKRGNSNSQGGMVGLAPHASNVMRPMRTRSSNDGHMCRFRGTDFLTAVTIGGTAAAAGDVLYTATVNPKTLGVSRLATVSQLWERYKFRRCSFRYAPTANATQTGQLIGYVDYDTYDDPTGVSGVQNLQRAAAHYGEKPVQIWDKTSWIIKDVDPLTDLYVDSDGTDPRWTNQGRLVVLAASAIASGVACGNIYMDYDVEFYIPQLEATPNTGFGWQVIGGGAMSAAAPFGAAPVLSSANNLPVTISGAALVLDPGSYIVTVNITGTVLACTGYGWTAGAGSTIVAARSNISAPAGSLNMSGAVMVVVTARTTLTSNFTATTVTANVVNVALLPSNAVSITQRKLNQISRMLKLCGDVESMQHALQEQVDKEDVPEAKECKLVRSGETASMSALASGNMGSTGSKIPLKVEEDYIVVKRGSGRS